jgi:hypothetical protein
MIFERYGTSARPVGGRRTSCTRPSVLLLCLAALGEGCSASGDVIPPLWIGRPGDRIPASTASNVFWVQADVNGDPGPQVILDTGAPIALLHVEAFNGAVPLGAGRVAAMTLGATTLWKVPTVGDHGDNSLTPTGKVDGGIVGFTAFGQFETSFNYRDNQVVIGAVPPPDGVLAPVTVPFSLEGGGAGRVSEGGDVIRFPASRVVLPVTVEGRIVSLLLDTGASWVGLRTSVYQAIVQDGRGQLTVEAMLAQGKTTTSIARLRSVVVGGAEVTGAAAASATIVDGLLDNLSSEVDHPIDGLLGAPYLREFHVTIDYPNRTLRLYRYADQSHVLDDYRKVGFDVSGIISPGGNSFVVQRVYPGTDAARQGVRTLENLLTIDGQLLFTLDVATVDRKLRGPVGATRKVQFSGRTLDVLVDELLPLP